MAYPLIEEAEEVGPTVERRNQGGHLARTWRQTAVSTFKDLLKYGSWGLAVSSKGGFAGWKFPLEEILFVAKKSK